MRNPRPDPYYVPYRRVGLGALVLRVLSATLAGALIIWLVRSWLRP